MQAFYYEVLPVNTNLCADGWVRNRPRTNSDICAVRALLSFLSLVGDAYLPGKGDKIDVIVPLGHILGTLQCSILRVRFCHTHLLLLDSVSED